MSGASEDLMLPLLLMTMAAAFVVVVMDDEEEEEEERQSSLVSTLAIAEALPVLRRKQRRLRLVAENNGEEPVRKKPRLFDYEGAMNCVQRDYLGPDPFFGHYFERIFRVSRGIVERLIQVTGAASSFFQLQHNRVTDKPGIRPEVKILCALKQLAFGTSGTAFLDYFQMSDTTARKCLKDFAKIVATSDLREVYLRSPTKADAQRLSRMHEVEFGVPGCIGCLDCTHVYWRTCPRAWHGQYEGKEGCATIVLEAIADYTTRIWHSCFGFPGTLNDINIWDQSPLLRAFLNGSFARDVDFEYEINGVVFDQLWIMVDGIYPELSRFVKNISEPITDEHKYYSKWQEACRKCVERAFGILKRKFHILVHDIELFFEHDIRYVVEACIILHNMMVEVRVGRDEEEHGDNYQVVADAHFATGENNGEQQEEQEEMQEQQNHTVQTLTTRERLDSLKQRWPHEHDEAEMHGAIKDHFQSIKLEWCKLYNKKRHFDLRDAVCAVVNDQRKK
jgi:Plant transposon protein